MPNLASERHIGFVIVTLEPIRFLAPAKEAQAPFPMLRHRAPMFRANIAHEMAVRERGKACRPAFAVGHDALDARIA